MSTNSEQTDIITVSQSQIKTKRLCFRKWGFQKIDGIDEPAGAGALFGGESHTWLEQHFGKTADFWLPRDGGPEEYQRIREILKWKITMKK